MRSFRSIGLDLHEWQILENAKSLLPVLEVYGRSPTDSEAMTLLMRHGFIRLSMMEKENEQKKLVEEMR